LLATRIVTHRWGPLNGLTLYVVGVIFASTIGVLAHGVHTPAYWTNVLILAIVVPLYGARAGVLLALWCALTGATWFVLQRLGWTTGLVYPPSMFTYIVMTGCMAAGIQLMAIPTTLLSSALHSSEQRRIEADQALKAEQNAELAFQAVFEQTGALTALAEPDGTIVRLNLTGERLLGVDGNAYIGRTLFDLPWVGHNVVEQLEDALHNATEGTERLEAEVLGPVGRRSLQLAIAPIKSLDGQVRTLVVEGLDVTRLLDAERELAHARRLEALGQLAGGVAHDFNNMLLAMQCALESLRSRQTSQDERVEAMETMELATARASDLTRKLLAFGRRDRFKTQIIDLQALIADAAQIFRRTLGAPIELALDFAAEDALIEGDAAAIEHALLNLVVNARDAMNNGGTLTLRTEVIVVDEAWCQSQNFPISPGRLVVLSVEDEGGGMTDDVLRRAFEPFFTTKAVGDGSGLGLAAVHGTMLSHGGGVTVKSQLGVGTGFHLYFPLAAGRRVSTRVPPSGVGHSLQLSGTVLVVDDEPLVQRVAKRCLKALGITAVVVGDGASAMAMIHAGQQFDCVVTDIVMPKMSGATLIGEIRRLRPELPIVVMSGFPAGPDGPLQHVPTDCPWLRKPFSRNDLAKVLAPVLGTSNTHLTTPAEA
jgi:PAS domain S-box-containing protein